MSSMPGSTVSIPVALPWEQVSAVLLDLDLFTSNVRPCRMVPMTELFTASRQVKSDTPEAAASAVREATTELHEILNQHGIDVSFDAIALLGHSESWDGEGQRWVHVSWPSEKVG